MDESERDPYRKALREQQPDWLGRPRSGTTARRPLWPQFGDSSEPTHWLVNLALVVAFCVVVMAVATAALREWRPTAPVVVGPVNVVVPANAQAAAVRSDVAAAEQLERDARAKAQEVADQRRQTAIKEREAQEEAAARAAALSARWEREWKAYYKPPSYCDNRSPDVDSVGCANDYIRARRQFDEQFIAGNRRP